MRFFFSSFALLLFIAELVQNKIQKTRSHIHIKLASHQFMYICKESVRDGYKPQMSIPIWANVSIATIVREILSKVGTHSVFVAVFHFFFFIFLFFPKHIYTKALQNIENSPARWFGRVARDFQNLDTRIRCLFKRFA